MTRAIAMESRRAQKGFLAVYIHNDRAMKPYIKLGFLQKDKEGRSSNGQEETAVSILPPLSSIRNICENFCEGKTART